MNEEDTMYIMPFLFLLHKSMKVYVNLQVFHFSFPCESKNAKNQISINMF